jgi:hypothetical protein
MTLEKLLIFGFALAVMIALTVTATNMSADRTPDYDGYQQKVQDTMNKMK